MRRLGVLFLIAALALGLGTVGSGLVEAAAAPPSIAATGAILVDLHTGRVLFSQNANEELAPASVTKIMTALLAIEHGGNLNRTVTVRASASGITGSSVYLEPGQKLSLKALLYGMLLVSGNDAATAVAQTIGGSVKHFVQEMNQEARALGATHTHFVNPDGLWAAQHYTSASDMAKITRAALKLPVFRQIVGTKSYLFPGKPKPFMIYNEDHMLWSYPGAFGVKTGYTVQADETLVSAAKRGHTELLAVFLHDSPSSLWVDPVTLLNWGFAHYADHTVLKAGQRVSFFAPVPHDRSIPVLAGHDLVLTTARGSRHAPLTRTLQWDRGIGFKVRRGETLGRVSYREGRGLIGTVPIVAARAASWKPPVPADEVPPPPRDLLIALGLMAIGYVVQVASRPRTRRAWGS